MSNEEYSRLQQSINVAMDEVLQRIAQGSGSVVVQDNSKPFKTFTSKRKAAVVQ
jgi:hypothetical protein